MSYTPRAGSAVARLIEHLREPDAPQCVTMGYIGELVGASKHGIYELLRDAVKAGLLVKTHDARGRSLISLGGQEASTEPPKAVAPQVPSFVPAPPKAATFKACIWADGEVYLYGCEPIAGGGVRLTAEQAEHVARLMWARA